MFIRMFGRHEHGGSLPLPPPTEDPLLAAVRRHVKRMRRLKIHVLAWALGITLLTTLWMVHEWQANGAFRHFGHEGNPGDWNPTLWALGIGIWTLVVGFKALQVLFEKPVTEAEVERAVERMRPSLTTKGLQTTADLRRFAFERLEGASRLRFHVAAWVFGTLVITPLWALIEWQDNGGFERGATTAGRVTGIRGSSRSAASGRSSSRSSRCTCISGRRSSRRSSARFAGPRHARRPASSPTRLRVGLRLGPGVAPVHRAILASALVRP
jgi:hypothetical protein